MPNMNDIARAAGVGKATVSLALRDDPRLRPETRARIQKVAQELGYETNATVANLMAQLRASRTPRYQATLALLNVSTNPRVIEELPTFASWARGAEVRARGLGYGLDRFWLQEPGVSPGRVKSILDSRGIRGVLLIGALEHGALGTRHAALWRGQACVALGAPTTPAFHFACNDQYATALTAVRRLRALGCQRPGLVINGDVDANVEHRFSAAFLAGAEAGRARVFDFAPGRFALFEKWMRREKPDAILCLHAEVRTWLERLGLRAPDGIALAHLDLNDQLGDWAGMNQNSEMVGAAAVDLVIGQLHRNEAGAPTHPKCLLIQSDWVAGATVPPR